MVLVGATAAISIALTKKHYLASKSDFTISDNLRSDLERALPQDLYKRLIAEWNAKAAGASARIAELQDLANKNKWKKYLYVGGAVAAVMVAKSFIKK
jgi:hypothetical protein